MKKVITGMLLVLLASSTAVARQFNADRIYFGGGLSSNELNGFSGDATGFQIFAGYPLDMKLGSGELAVEAGYMDSGEFEYNIPFFGTVSTEAKGLWGTAVGKWPVGRNLNIIGRLGLDIGDDDGLMFGGGVGFKVAKNLDLRAEYVIRDHIDSLQLNVVYYP